MRQFFFFIVIFVIYANSLGNEFVSDDIAGILYNPNLRDLSSVFTSPLSSFQSFRPILYYLTNLLFGLSPWAFRITNIFFHFGTVSVLYLILSLISTPRIAKISALLFAVHPILTESITWISGGSYPQYSFFILTSLLFFILSVKKNTYLYVSLLFLLLSLSTSEKAMIFPLIIIAFIFSYKLRPKNLVSFFLLLIPGGAIALIYSSIISVRLEKVLFSYENQIINPLLQIPIAITSYLQLIFWPIPLTLYHSEMSFTQTEFAVRFIIFIIFIIFIGISFFKNKPVFFWLSFFVISLLPTLTPFGISWIVAERYVYLGTIGIIVVCAMAIEKISRILKNEKIAYIITAVLVILLSIRTIARNSDWQNQDTLWIATAKYSPNSPQNHNNLGDMYGRHNDLPKAAEEFQIAIKLKPDYGDAYHNLAGTYLNMDKTELAIENYRKALSFNPLLWQSYQNLGAIYFHQNDFSQAEEYFRKAISVNPQNPNLHFNLGVIYLKLNDKDKARQEFFITLRLDPQNLSAEQALSETTTPR